VAGQSFGLAYDRMLVRRRRRARGTPAQCRARGVLATNRTGQPRSATTRHEQVLRWGTMSTSDAAYEWDLTVPGDDAELAGEFRRHGIRPGQQVHVAVVTNNANGEEAGEALPSFFASFDGPADLAERSSEILSAEFPSGR
jgi:hypothetical protein